MVLRTYTNKKWSSLNHVILTSDVDWDPTCLDCEGKLDNEEWFDTNDSNLLCFMWNNYAIT